MKKLIFIPVILGAAIFVVLRSERQVDLAPVSKQVHRGLASEITAQNIQEPFSEAASYYTEPSDIFSEIEAGNWKALDKYLSEGGDPHLKDSQGRGFLHWAALQGQNKMIQKLISLGVDIDGQDETGLTALMLATSQAQEESLEKLLKAGASVFKENEIGQTALLLAVEASNADGFEKLKAAGADLHDRFGKAELDAYLLASSNRDTKMMDRLIQADPNFVHSEDIEGRTVSHHACAEGAIEVVATAIRHGGDLNRPNRKGQSALGYAKESGNDSCIAFVEEAGLRDFL